MSSRRRYKQDSFGDLFKRLRKESGFSVEYLSKKTKIQKRYLECLEREEFDKLPPNVYVKGFISKCGAVFGKDEPRKLMELYVYCIAGNESNRSVSPARGGYFLKNTFSFTPRHLTVIAASLFVLALAVYFLLRFVPFLFSPEISLIHLPNDNLIVNFSEISVSGTTKYTSSLTLNGKELYIGEDGAFDKALQLNAGVNILKFEAKNIFGRKTEIVKRVVYIKD